MNAVEKIVQDAVQGALGTPEARKAEAERTASLIAESKKLISQWDAAATRRKEMEDPFILNNLPGAVAAPSGGGTVEADDFIRGNLPGAA